MPKKVIEISNFNSGIVSSASQTDIPENSAKYSNNIDPITTQGRLEGINKDKVLSSTGFEVSGDSNALSLNFAEFTTYADKTDTSKVNLVGLEPSSTNAIQKIISIEDVYNAQTTSAQTLLDNISSVANEFSLLTNDNQVHVGLGGGSTNSKVVMKANSNPLKSANNSNVSVYDSALNSVSPSTLSSQFEIFYVPVIHGIAMSDSETAIDTSDMQLGYDVSVTIAGANTLYTALNTGTYGSSGSLNGLKVGQIFKINSSQDTNDDALLAWKRYDYDADATLAEDDMFMFCGYLSNPSGGGDVPIVSYIGNEENMGGTPAFAYGVKEGGSKLYKISLADTTDLGASEFDGTTSANIKDSLGNNYSVVNTGERMSTIDLSSVLGQEGYISSLTNASSPTLFNNINLVGKGEDYGTSQNVYTDNGHLDVYYRQGIFWFASSNSTTQIYKVNAIDFHGLTSVGTSIETFNLDFTKIPSQLHAEDGNGIIRRTLEDQATNNDYDPKKQTWSNIPEGAEIVGLCETFESGKIKAIEDKSEDYDSYSNIWEFKAQGRVQPSSSDMADLEFAHETWRLTSGDVVRFAGMNPSNAAFNQGISREVSVIKDGQSFIIQTEQTPALNTTTTTGYNLWWNSKLWIMYGKKTTSSSFQDWDLFLYNTNTIDISSDKSLKMADRTVPYHQARYYISEANSVNQKGQSRTRSGNKIYYPGQFAFIHKIDTSNLGDPSTVYNPENAKWKPENYSADNFVAPKHNITCTDDGVNSQDHHVSFFNFNLSSHVQDYFTGFGIYNKQGKWARNGKFSTINDIVLGRQPDDKVYGSNAYHDPVENNTSFDSGPLLWGENIGWDIDTGRQIRTVRNSLVPKTRHSACYMAHELHISRKLISTVNGVPFIINNVSPSQTAATYIQPMHSVTFLGFTTGDFVVRPQRISRRYTDKLQSGNITSDTAAIIDSLGFASHHVNISDIKSYQDSLTLYTIDDFSGHRGSVKFGNDASVSLTLADKGSYTSGVEQNRPNFGGPEIENPNHCLGGDILYPLSSVNHGYGDTTANSKGWDGYTPPTLLNPGSGYYVYINRSWKCQTLDMPALERYQLAIGDITTNFQQDMPNNFTWNFNSDDIADTNKIRSNNAHNFSSTCIADCLSSDPKEENANFPFIVSNEQDYAFWGDPVTADYLPGRRFWRETRFGFMSEDIYTRTFGAENEYNPVAVCTFNAINVNFPIDKVNNAFVTTFAKIEADSASKDAPYNTNYICGVRKRDNSGSGILIVRNNLDSVYGKILRTPTTLESDIYNTFNDWASNAIGDWNRNSYGALSDKEPSAIITAFEKKEYDFYLGSSYLATTGQKYNLAFRNTGTNKLEILNITDQLSVYMDESPVGVSQKLQMRQAAFYGFDNTIIGDDLVVMTRTPDIPEFRTSSGSTGSHGLELDLIASVSSLQEDSLYFGHFDNAFATDDVATSSNTEGKYAEDAGGTWSGSLNQFFTGTSDNDIWQKNTQFVEFSDGGSDGLTADTYYYKFSYEYDGQYESPLNEGFAKEHTISSDKEFIRLTLFFSSDKIESLSQRITGISVYRKQAGQINNEDNTYYLLKNIPFSDPNWFSTSEGFSYHVDDKGDLGPSYEAINGLPQTISNASLNYGLSTNYQGYIFVSKATHPDLEDVKRYIFRSQPDNYFAFDYTKDFVIMPEIPVAMTSFNSRLYVWGKNKLYKIDPFSLIIEDEYEGIGIAGKNAYVKTEFGLCFLDKNNVYIHDGNKPNPIASSILYATADTIDYETDATGTDGYYLLQQGYRDLVQQTIDNGDDPNVFYLGRKNSFVVNLSDKAKDGKCFVFNIDQKRWDLWDAPRPKSVNSSQDSDILINDGANLFNYIDAESELYGTYNKRPWSWFSKDLTIGANNIDKIFRGFTFLGTPSIYNYDSEGVSAYDTSDGKTNSIQVFIDGEQVIPIIKNTMYETVSLGNTKLVAGGGTTQVFEYDTTLYLQCDLREKDVVGGGTTSGSVSKRQEFISPGHLIKVGDEIMLVLTVNRVDNSSSAANTRITVLRAQMGTTSPSLYTITSNSTVNIVSPRFKMPARSRGKHMSIRLLNQEGYVDAMSISYKLRSVKF